MKVNLTYFKQSGKYYSSGSCDVPDSYAMYDIHKHVESLKLTRTLPDLGPGHSNFIVLIDVPDHEHNHPILIPFNKAK